MRSILLKMAGSMSLALAARVASSISRTAPKLAAKLCNRVAASRQVQQGGQWIEAPVQAATVQKLEDIILTKARDLRRAAIAG